MESGGGGEQNYWPGFVDALSNVVLTLVFVLVIFVFALVMASNKVEKKMQEIVAIKKEEQELKEKTPDLQAAIAEIEQLKEKLKQATASRAGDPLQSEGEREQDNENLTVLEKPKENAYIGTMSMVEKQNLITLNFPTAVANMDDESAEKLGKVFAGLQKTMGGHKIVLRSIIGTESYSVARRMAYYRALDVRNFLISKAGEDPGSITAVIVQPEKPENGRVEIVIKKN